MISNLLSHTKYLTIPQIRNFPRQIPRIKPEMYEDDFKEKEKRKKWRQEEHTREMEDKELEKDTILGSLKPTKDSKYEEYKFHNLHYNNYLIPKLMEQRVQRVFTKYHLKDLREWGDLLMKNYQRLWAIEKPFNLKGLKSFANSDVVIKKGKERFQLHKLLKKAKQREDKEEAMRLQGLIDLDQKGEETYVKGEKKSKSQEKEETTRQIFSLQYGQTTAVAYLLRQMPHSYFVAKKLLLELKARVRKFHPVTMLDYGAGLGSGIWACSEVFPQIKKYYGIEPSVNMRKLGKFLTGELDISITWVDSLGIIPGGFGVPNSNFDIVLIQNVLQEISNQNGRKMVVESLWNRVNENGYLILIEPGTPKGFRFILDIREMFLKMDRETACFVAPCPHHCTCPLLGKERTWCHFSQLVPKFKKEIFPRSQIKSQLDNQKFSYLIIKKGTTPNITFADESDAEHAEDKSYFWDRVIRPAIRKQKHIILDVCSKSSELERKIIGKSHGVERGYKIARNIHWGDLWYFAKQIPHKFRKESKFGPRLW